VPASSAPPHYEKENQFQLLAISSEKKAICEERNRISGDIKE
jgi:hypothetical protein